MKLLAQSLLFFSAASAFSDCGESVEPGRTSLKPNGIYIDNLDGTVTDTQTNLMWQKCAVGRTWSTGANPTDPTDDECTGNGHELTWQASLAFAKDNEQFEHSDWRLPNYKELVSIFEPACYPSINSLAFPDFEAYPDSGEDNYFYWTSTHDRSAPSAAFSFGFSYSQFFARNKSDYEFQRSLLVRTVSE